MRRCRCVTPVAVLAAFGLGLILSYLLPATVLVILLALSLLCLCGIRTRR